MRIGMLHNAYRYRGGEERVVQAESEILREAGHEVHALTFDNRDAFASLGPTLRNAVGCASGWNASASARVASWARKHQLDVVHVHNLFPLITPAGADVLGQLRVPAVMTLHNFRLICAAGTLTRNGAPCDDCITGSSCHAVCRGCYRGSRAQSLSWWMSQQQARQRGSWGRISRFIAPTAHVRETHVQAGFSQEQIVVRPHFTDMPVACKRSHESLVVIGRVERAKGIPQLVEAWPANGPELIVIGTGPELEPTRCIAGHNVRFTGQIGREEIAEHLSRAAALISVSELPETFGLTIAEAFSSSTPAVSFDRGGPADIITHGKTGVLCACGDYQTLMQEAVALARDTCRAQAMGSNAFETYVQRYSPAAGLASLIEVYEQAIAPQSIGAAA